jgi:hypothetical protein
MVTLPRDFVATRYPGYFWNVVEKKLYSIKVTGELKAMTFNKGGTFYGVTYPAGYRISVQGRKRTYPMDYLLSLKATKAIQQIGIAS